MTSQRLAPEILFACLFGLFVCLPEDVVVVEVVGAEEIRAKVCPRVHYVDEGWEDHDRLREGSDALRAPLGGV